MERDSEKITVALDTLFYNGFGGWHVEKDGKLIYQGPNDMKWEDYSILQEFEDQARGDPDHDWRAILETPLRDAVYQRQDKDEWILISSGPGFA